MATKPRRILARHALTIEELDFCKHVAAGLNYTEAYRRSHFKDPETGRYRKGNPDIPEPKTANREAKQLLDQEHIQAHLEELKNTAGEHARLVLEDQAKFGVDSSARSAAEKILAAEDKMGFRDAVSQWASIIAEIGADIVVPLPDRCPHCQGQIEVSVPASMMFTGQEK